MAKSDTQADGEISRIIEPELPIVDSHHHLWQQPTRRYLIDEYQADLASGHNVVATVFVECNAMYRQSGPEQMRTVGEAEFVAGTAAMSESGLFGPTRICSSFVGSADLTLGAEVDEVLDALTVASGGRLSAIRGMVKWDADSSVHTGSRPMAPKGLMNDTAFRAGVGRLASHNLVYESSQNFPQLPEVCNLADEFPDTTIVVDHCGGLLGIGPYARPDNFLVWKSLIAEIARRPNAVMKVGGISARVADLLFIA